MKQLLIFLLLSFNAAVSAQDTATKPFVCLVPLMPEFPGEEAMMKFIQKDIIYPAIDREVDVQG